MIKHIFTVERLAIELGGLTGGVIEECFTQDKDSCEIIIRQGREFKCLHFSVAGNMAAMFVRKHFSRARKNTLDILPDLQGETIQEVKAVPGERIIKIEMIHTDIYAILFGGALSNLVVTTKAGRIIDALENNGYEAGTGFCIKRSSFRSIDEFESSTPILNVIAKCDLFLGKYYAAELCSRAGIDPEQPLKDVQAPLRDKIKRYAEQIRSECLASSEFYLLHDPCGVDFLSLIPLSAFPEISAKFDTLSEAIGRHFVGSIVAGEFEPAKRGMLKIIDAFIHKLGKNIEATSKIDEARRRADDYRMTGEMLLYASNGKSKHGTEIELEDWAGQKKLIKLDPKLNLIENGEKYFRKAAKTTEDIKIRKKRLPGMLKKMEEAGELKAMAEEAQTIKEIDKIKDKWQLLSGKKMQGEEIKTEEKFRKFELGEGFVVYVGKNSANNDELTMKFAKPHDMWMHARGTSGSHGVVPLEKDRKLPKNILKAAAEIVAYYSGARNAKYVPVCYTRKMNVKKFKGAAQGAVTISREEIVMVEPRLPEGKE